MKDIKQYLVNEGLKDSFINIIKNLFNHGEVNKNKLVTIENVDPKVFGALVRDKEYYSPNTNEYPKLIPLRDYTVDDMWELYSCTIGEDKYGNKQDVFTFIGHADFKNDRNKIEVEENYKELVEKVLAKYKK
jgi:hypothetical protein